MGCRHSLDIGGTGLALLFLLNIALVGLPVN